MLRQKQEDYKRVGRPPSLADVRVNESFHIAPEHTDL
jgi:hypothetical protein